MRVLKRILPHICIIISFMILTLCVIDQVNSAMNFINNNIFKSLLFAYCIAVIATSIVLISENRRRKK
jgi:hypothetical protein